MEAISEDETSIDMTGEEDAWAWSNLGGLGPDTDAPSQTFRRSKVGKVGNVFIDLIVSNVTEFKPKLQAPGRVVDWSGSVVNGYGQISLDGTEDASATTHMDLKLSFVEHGTDTPYTLTKFRFAFFDFVSSALLSLDLRLVLVSESEVDGSSAALDLVSESFSGHVPNSCPGNVPPCNASGVPSGSCWSIKVAIPGN